MTGRVLRLAEPRFGDEALEAIGRVLASGNLTQGPVVAEFEAAIAEFVRRRAPAWPRRRRRPRWSSRLAALDIGPGDEVAAADFTYPATGNAVLQRGATLRLVDVDPDDLLHRPGGARGGADAAHPAPCSTVDVFGLPADYRAIEPLLADARHRADLRRRVLARRRDRRRAARAPSACMSCFSFHPRKSLTTGEGGMVVTDDDALADRLRRLRNHGTERGGWRATFVEPGYNYRLSRPQRRAGPGAGAAASRAAVARRRELAAALTERLEGVDGIAPQRAPEGFTHPVPGVRRDLRRRTSTATR